MNLLEYLLSEEDAPWLGVTACSLVRGAADGTQAVAMSGYQMMVPTEDRVFKGVFVKANTKAKQKYGKGQSSFFTPETIKRMKDRFHKSGADKRISIHHELDGEGNPVPLNDCFVTDSYIVKNEHDVASLEQQGILGSGIGDWVVGVKVSEEVWENDIKKGEVDGLSLEGAFRSRKVTEQGFENKLTEASRLIKEILKT